MAEMPCVCPLEQLYCDCINMCSVTVCEFVQWAGRAWLWTLTDIARIGISTWLPLRGLLTVFMNV